MSDDPIPGFYRAPLTKGGPPVAIKIWHGAPIVDGVALDRAPRWNIAVDGRTDMTERDDNGYRALVPLDVMRYWPYCGRQPITRAQYRHMRAYADWAKLFAPNKPQASPRTKVNIRGRSVLP